MMHDGELFELPTSARRTGENGSSLWPTPDAGTFNTSESVESFEARRARIAAMGINGNGMGTPLGIAVKLWPTPTSTDHKASGVAGYSTESGRHSGTTPTDAVVRKLWATPTNSMATMGDMEQASTAGNGSSRKPYESKGSLNPVWVEALMGFPQGWLDGLLDQGKHNTNGNRRARSKKPTTEPRNSERSATQLSRKSRKK
jgi:hypothetical protein